MKKFICKLVIFFCLDIVLLSGFLILSAKDRWRMPIARLTKSEEYFKGNVGAGEIIPYIEKVQEKNSYTKLILGDSVCNQVYNRFQVKNDIYCIAGTNRAVTLAGQYLLAEEFIKNHDKVTDIYLIILMDSLITDFDYQFGYQYVIMPFTETDTIQFLKEDTKKELYRKYGRIFCQKPVVKIIDKSPLNRKLYLNFLVEKDKVSTEKSTSVISRVSYEYLEKLYYMCEEAGIELHLLSGPHADTPERHQLEERMKKELERKGIMENFESYFNSITYFSIDLFRDGVHFDEEVVTNDFYEEIIYKTCLKDFKVK